MGSPDALNKSGTHYLFPGNIFAHREPYIVTTVLGSCISVTLFDAINRIGGINHYMLPLWNGEGLPTPKYGNIAISKLLDKLMSLGADRRNIKAKVIGGASMYGKSKGFIDIGGRNIAVAEDCLKEEGIPVVSSDTGGIRGRKILFFTETGIVRVKTLNTLGLDKI